MIFEIQKLKQAFKDYSSDDKDIRILNNIKETLQTQYPDLLANYKITNTRQMNESFSVVIPIADDITICQFQTA